MRMKNYILLFLVGLLGVIFHSCNYLDVDTYFEDTFQQDSIFHSKRNAEGYLWNTPKDFPDPGAIWGGSWNPVTLGSDEMTARWRTSEFPGILFSVCEINEWNFPGSFKNLYNILFMFRSLINKLTYL